MRIGIDCRMVGTGEGIARYSEELVRHLAEIDFRNEYFLIFRKRASSKFKVQNSKFRIVEVDSPYYSFAEQTRFIGELNRLKLDLVHFPNFNVPIFYGGRFVITIHDIIHHQFPGKKKSRFYHRLAYRWVIRSAVNRASQIIAVSEATKQDLINTFKVKPDKITVVYEGIDEKFFNKLTVEQVNKIKLKYNIAKPYLLFVGVWRQYKNLPRLAMAFDMLKQQGLDYQLVLVGKIDRHYPEIKNQILNIKNSRDVLPLGYVPDRDLPALYQGASVFVLPSLVEGFGLIGVEAQASGLSVVASDILVLREVLGRGASYFNPRDVTDMTEKIKQALLQPGLDKQGKENARRFNWLQTAKQTFDVYSYIRKNS